MQWFRMYHEFATDPKVQMLSEVDQRRYVMILCFKCCNVTVTLRNEEVAFQLRCSNDEWARTKAVLLEKNLITESNEPTAWDKRQYVSDTSNERVKRHREKKKQEVKQACNVTVTAPDTDTDTDTEETLTAVSAVVPDKSETPECPHKKIIALYHEILPGLPKIREWGKKRMGYLKSRWAESEERQNIDYWRGFFEYVGTCDFLMGRTPQGWKANLEWLVNSSNFIKVVEGFYANRDRATG